MTAADYCTDAMREIGVLAQGQTPSNDDAVYVLGKLNRLLDNWNAEQRAVYNETFAVYTLTPNLQPHTIGPTGTFTVTQRPVTVDGANIVLNNVSPAVRSPLTLRTDTWWLANTVRGVTTTLSTDLYYSPDWPNGSLYLWPVPTVAYQLELMTRVVLATLALATSISLPPGYQDAITLTLAENIAVPMGREVPRDTVIAAMRARARIFANNGDVASIRTLDSGMPCSHGSGQRATFNYRTGQGR